MHDSSVRVLRGPGGVELQGNGTLGRKAAYRALSMHELSICYGIMDIARGALDGLPGLRPRVSGVTVRIGRLAAVVPDSLSYYFDLLTPGTDLAGARLVIEEVPVRGRCADCAATFEIATLSFTCPCCGGGLVELLSGRELQVVSVETEEEATCAS